MNSSTPDMKRGITMASTTFACASCCRPMADSLGRLGSVRCHDCLETQAPVREACVTARRPQPRERDHRENNGIAVTLLWYEDVNRVAVRVADTRSDEEFELEVDPRDALDAFRHPYSYLLADAA
jgi:hypothetical protein